MVKYQSSYKKYNTFIKVPIVKLKLQTYNPTYYARQSATGQKKLQNNYILKKLITLY